jgi:hypothetical protein
MRDPSDTNEFCNRSSTWWVIHPRFDRTRVCIIEISKDLEYEINDCLLASEKSFPGDPDGAYAHAAMLAEERGLKLFDDIAFA